MSRSKRVEAIATANHVSTLQAVAIAKGALHFIFSRLNNKDKVLMMEMRVTFRTIRMATLIVEIITTLRSGESLEE